MGKTCIPKAPLHESGDSDNDLHLQTQAFIDTVIGCLPASQSRLDQIKYHYNSDTICLSLMTFCKEGWPEKSKLCNTMKPYWSDRGDFIV